MAVLPLQRLAPRIPIAGEHCVYTEQMIRQWGFEWSAIAVLLVQLGCGGISHSSSDAEGAASETLGLASLCADPGDSGLGQVQAGGGLAVAMIVESPSYDTDGSECDIYCDGSTADYTLRRHSGAGPVPTPPIYSPQGTPWAVQCLAALQALGDVSTIAVDRSNCMKSISFGTTTTIWFDGKSTPDLECPWLPHTAAQSAVLTACL